MRVGASQPRLWHRLTLAAVAGGGIALSAILAVHLSNVQIEEKRQQLIVEATGFADDLEEYLQSREMIAKTVGTVFEAPDLSQPGPLRSIGKKVLALTPDIAVMAWIPQVDPSRIHDVLDALSAAGRPPQLYGPNFETRTLPILVACCTRLWTLNRSWPTTRSGSGWTSVSFRHARQPSNRHVMNSA